VNKSKIKQKQDKPTLYDNYETNIIFVVQYMF